MILSFPTPASIIKSLIYLIILLFIKYIEQRTMHQCANCWRYKDEYNTIPNHRSQINCFALLLPQVHPKGRVRLQQIITLQSKQYYR